MSLLLVANTYEGKAWKTKTAPLLMPIAGSSNGFALTTSSNGTLLTNNSLSFVLYFKSCLTIFLVKDSYGALGVTISSGDLDWLSCSAQLAHSTSTLPIMLTPV
jgi:hypothetical protein